MARCANGGCCQETYDQYDYCINCLEDHGSDYNGYGRAEAVMDNLHGKKIRYPYNKEYPRE